MTPRSQTRFPFRRRVGARSASVLTHHPTFKTPEYTTRDNERAVCSNIQSERPAPEREPPEGHRWAPLTSRARLDKRRGRRTTLHFHTGLHPSRMCVERPRPSLRTTRIGHASHIAFEHPTAALDG